MTVDTDVIQSLNPATGDLIEEVPVTDPDRAEELVVRAREARESWSDRPIVERVNRLEEAARNLEDRSDELARNLTKEQGKPLTESRGEVRDAAERIRYFCERAPELLSAENVEVDETVTGVVHREPYGIVAAITPWNFPVNIPVWSIVPALLGGNTVLFKPSELTPVTGRLLVECFPEELHENNVLNLVQGGGEVGRSLVEHEDVAYVSFVGSRRTGEWIYKVSSSHLRDVSLELGGKDPFLVLEDADVGKAVEDLLHGGFKNCGQVCCGIERCLVHESLYETFREDLTERVGELTVGHGLEEGTDLGPMVRETEVERVRRHLEDAREKGAEVVSPLDRTDRANGYWQDPALVFDADPSMDVMNEETFGPVVALMPVGGDESALEEANRLEYGLGASVYSKDPDHAREVASDLEAGSVGVNQTVGSIVQLPWGGVKKSGVGRLLGREGLKKFTQSVVHRWNPEELDDLDG